MSEGRLLEDWQGDGLLLHRLLVGLHGGGPEAVPWAGHLGQETGVRGARVAKQGVLGGKLFPAELTLFIGLPGVNKPPRQDLLEDFLHCVGRGVLAAGFYALLPQNPLPPLATPVRC